MRYSWIILTLGCISLCYSAEYELNFDAGETADRNVCQAFLEQKNAKVDSSLCQDKLPLNEFIEHEFGGAFHLTNNEIYRQDAKSKEWIYWGEALGDQSGLVTMYKWMGKLENGRPSQRGPQDLPKFSHGGAGEYYAEGGRIQLLPAKHRAIWHLWVMGQCTEKVLKIPLKSTTGEESFTFARIDVTKSEDQLRQMWGIPADKPLVYQDAYEGHADNLRICAAFELHEADPVELKTK